MLFVGKCSALTFYSQPYFSDNLHQLLACIMPALYLCISKPIHTYIITDTYTHVHSEYYVKHSFYIGE